MKRFQKNLFILLIVISWSMTGHAYVQNRTTNDTLVHWTSSISLINIFINPTNTQSYPETDVHAQVSAAVAQWDGKSRINLRKNTTAGTNQENVNEIYFSTDPNYFGGGTGVVGITQVYFKNNTGEIIEADILLNDNYTFEQDILDPSYLGNVITHEIGHFLGLGHSQVSGSTMFYALSRGQSGISDDDKAGLYSIYPNGDSTKASITGKVVGGSALISVFGVHVQAVSLNTGRVAGSNISDTDGVFVIDGLSKSDKYFIYTAPIAQIGLPSRYNTARNDFCDSSKKFRSSFFQACGASGEGYPQAVSLTSSQVNVGNVTIRCGLDVPVDYIQNKDSVSTLFDIQDNVSSGIGNSFVGYFSEQEITLNKTDNFTLNYSGVDWSAIAASGDLYVELKILNQSFYSPFKAKVEIKQSGVTTPISPKYISESDGWLNLDTTVRLPINRSPLSDNDFEVIITPQIMTEDTLPSGLPYSKADYFPASSYFEDSLYFYLATASIVKDNGNGTYSMVSYKNETVGDNTMCPDAINTYALTTFTSKGTTSTPAAKKKDKGFLGCGTVDMQGGPGNGPGGFFIGLILSLILCSLTSSIIKNNRPKHYSKIA